MGDLLETNVGIDEGAHDDGTDDGCGEGFGEVVGNDDGLAVGIKALKPFVIAVNQKCMSTNQNKNKTLILYELVMICIENLHSE